jgi:DNA excision repair protein ERCC-8
MAHIEKRNVPALPGPLFKLLEEQREGRLRPLAIQRAVMDIRARQVQLSNLREIMPPHSAEVTCMAVDAVEDRYLLCGHANGALAIIDVEENPSPDLVKFECVVRLVRGDAHSFGVTGVGWYPRDTGMFVTGSFDKSVRVWDTNTAADVYTFQMAEKEFDFALPETASQHSLIAVASGDQRACLCDLNSGARQHSLAGHRGPVHSVAWSNADEFILATGGEDGTLRLWDIRRTAACVAMLSKDEAPRVRKRRRFGVERDEFDEEAAAARRGYAPIAHTGGVSAALFSPDGRCGVLRLAPAAFLVFFSAPAVLG